jgi:hypothetical protein
MKAWSEISTLIPCVPAGGEPPRIKWWGNVFRRVWRDRTQLVIVLRLPYWGRAYCITLDEWRLGQFCVAWRQGEGWRRGWIFR